MSQLSIYNIFQTGERVFHKLSREFYVIKKTDGVVSVVYTGRIAYKVKTKKFKKGMYPEIYICNNENLEKR
jgi:hypothetical protein